MDSRGTSLDAIFRGSLDPAFNVFQADDVKEAARISKGLKSPDEIARLTVPENLSDIERGALLLFNGSSIQKQSVLDKLPSLYKAQPLDAFDKLFLPWMSNERLDKEMKGATVQVLTVMFTDQSVQAASHIQSLLNYILQEINLQIKSTPEDCTECDLWVDPLLLLLPALSRGQISTITDFVLEKGEVSKCGSSRYVSSKVLSVIIPYISSALVQGKFLQQCITLCQDTIAGVRANMCIGLTAICQAAGMETTRSVILPELEELLRDEELAVRLAALDTMAKMLELLPLETRMKTVIPWLRHLCMHPPLGTVPALARIFGPCMVRVATDLEAVGTASVPADFMQPFYSFFHSLPNQNDVEARRMCAYNFPGVLKSWGVSAYSAQLHYTLLQLVADSDEAVRRTVASGLHEVAILLGGDRVVTFLRQPLLTLIGDSDKEVPRCIVKNIGPLLEVFTQNKTEEKEIALSDILQGLSEYEKRINLTWRLRLELLEQLHIFPKIFSAEQLHHAFVPVLFRCIMEGAVPERNAASSAICVFVRYHPQSFHRNELVQRIITELAHGRSSGHRLQFVALCQNFLHTFSRRWFKAHIFDTIVALVSDPVATVRIQACRLLPALKRTLQLPEDALRLDLITRSTSHLVMDYDRNVNAAAQAMVDELSQVTVRDTRRKGLASYMDDHEHEDLMKQRQEDALDLAEMQNGGEGLYRSTAEEDSKTRPARKKNLMISIKSPGSPVPNARGKAGYPNSPGPKSPLLPSLNAARKVPPSPLSPGFAASPSSGGDGGNRTPMAKAGRRSSGSLLYPSSSGSGGGTETGYTSGIGGAGGSGHTGIGRARSTNAASPSSSTSSIHSTASAQSSTSSMHSQLSARQSPPARISPPLLQPTPSAGSESGGGGGGGDGITGRGSGLGRPRAKPLITGRLPPTSLSLTPTTASAAGASGAGGGGMGFSLSGGPTSSTNSSNVYTFSGGGGGAASPGRHAPPPLLSSLSTPHGTMIRAHSTNYPMPSSSSTSSTSSGASGRGPLSPPMHSPHKAVGSAPPRRRSGVLEAAGRINVGASGANVPRW